MLNKLQLNKTRRAKRVGRGYGSGKGGHTSGRGQKGQKSRSGYKPARRGFEGGGMPLSRRLPKLRGFKRGFFKARTKNYVINLDQLNTFADDSVITPDKLIEAGFVRPANRFTIKILANGTLTKKLKFENISASASARKKIEAAGGSFA